MTPERKAEIQYATARHWHAACSGTVLFKTLRSAKINDSLSDSELQTLAVPGFFHLFLAIQTSLPFVVSRA